LNPPGLSNTAIRTNKWANKTIATFILRQHGNRPDSTQGKPTSAELAIRHAQQLNLHIAKVYLAGTDSGVSTRTWQNALDAIIETKRGPTQDRWRRAAKESALDMIRHRVIIETQAEHLFACLKAGTVSTNVHLRKLHNFCLSMNWLPWPLIPKRLWPELTFQPKRAITIGEHQLIIEREKNPERRSFYELCWHLGGSQIDIASLKAEDIDWRNQTIAYTRQKTGSLAMIHFGPDIEAILRRLPVTGPLFPYLQTVRCGDRATEFKQRCAGLGITGGAGKKSLHYTDRGRLIQPVDNESGHFVSAANATEQFRIADARPPQEIACLVRRLGYEPVWKDWDAALMAAN